MKNKILMAALVLFALGLAGCDITISSTSQRFGGQSEEMEKSEIMTGKYQDFSAEKFAEIRGNKKLVLFFHAKWCGTCRKWEKELIKELPELPAEAIVLKVNYDKEKGLVKELQVKSQSSAVFFDEKGEMVDTLIDPDMEKLAEFFREKMTDDEMKENKMEEDKAMMDDKEEEIIQDYSSELRSSLAGQKYLIFFYADWCPTCRNWKKNISENLSELPANTKILIAKYDSETDLKKEFQITSQSMAVFVSEEGTFESKLDPDLEAVKTFFQD